MGKATAGVTGMVVWVLAIGVLAMSSPSIAVEESIYDFGWVIEGTTVKHTFLISNQGDSDLEILDVRAGCGCTTTELPFTTLIPGRVVELDVSLSTAGFGGSTVGKSVIIRSNDPDRPELVLQLVGSVVPDAAYLIDVSEISGGFRLLLDVRPRNDYVAGHLVGAVSMPADEVPSWLDYMPKDVAYLLYDQAGRTAPDVAEIMLSAGFAEVSVIIGGMSEWIREYGDRSITQIELILLPLLEATLPGDG